MVGAFPLIVKSLVTVVIKRFNNGAAQRILGVVEAALVSFVKADRASWYRSALDAQ